MEYEIKCAVKAQYIGTKKFVIESPSPRSRRKIYSSINVKRSDGFEAKHCKHDKFLVSLFYLTYLFEIPTLGNSERNTAIEVDVFKFNKYENTRNYF